MAFPVFDGSRFKVSPKNITVKIDQIIPITKIFFCIINFDFFTILKIDTPNKIFQKIIFLTV